MIFTTKKPSIAIFLNSFWVSGRGMSGGDQMAIQIFSRIKGAFAEVSWFTSTDGKIAIDEVIDSAEYSISSPWFDKLPIGLSYILRTIHASFFLFFKNPNIIYAGSDFFPDVLPAFIYTRFKKKTLWVQCVFHIYPDWWTRPGNKMVNFFASMLQRVSLVLARYSHGIVNINKEVGEELLLRKFNPEKIVVITPGIDLDYIDSVPIKVDEHTIVYDAVFLGRLVPSKGIYDLPLIWKLVTESITVARLAIIGSGNKAVMAKLEADLLKYGLQKNVDVLGYLETEKIYILLKQARAFIFPSHEEGFGIAIVEAMACGTPVVSWELSVYKELFEEAIVTAPLGDANAFAKKLLLLLHEQDKNVVRIAQGHQVAKRYSWGTVSQDMQLWLLQIWAPLAPRREAGDEL